MSASVKLRSFFRLLKQAIKGDENQDYTSLSINKAIFLLSIPMLLEMFMESLFVVIDIYWVSRLNDKEALAAVGLTESVLTIVYSIAMGLSMGATALVARRVGEKDIPAARVAAVQALFIGVGFSLVISISGLFFSEEILELMGAGETLIRNNVSYTKWMFGGNFTIMLLFIINAVFRGAGDASVAMKALCLANGLNIILDPIFIFGAGPIPGLGVEGAAIATNIGRGCGVLYQVYHLLHGKSQIKIYRDNLTIRWNIIGRLLVLSAGGAGQFLIASASWIFLVRIMSVFGSVVVAGYTVAIRLIGFAILPAWGVANAAATLVGQNLGAGFPDRAEKSVWRTSFVNMLFLGAVSVIFLLMGAQLLSPFSPDEEVLGYGVQCLHIVAAGYVFYAYGMVVIQSFNGAGDTRTPTLINFFGFWLFQIPLAYALALVFDFGAPGVYAAIPIAESTVAVVAVLIFRRGKWKTVKI